jgi:hypothetical protein
VRRFGRRPARSASPRKRVEVRLAAPEHA